MLVRASCFRLFRFSLRVQNSTLPTSCSPPPFLLGGSLVSRLLLLSPISAEDGIPPLSISSAVFKQPSCFISSRFVTLPRSTPNFSHQSFYLLTSSSFPSGFPLSDRLIHAFPVLVRFIITLVIALIQNIQNIEMDEIRILSPFPFADSKRIFWMYVTPRQLITNLTRICKYTGYICDD